MGFLRYLWLLLKVAFRHSIGHAQTTLFVIFIAAGAATWLLKPHHAWAVAMIPDVTGWQIAALVLGAILLVRLMLASYWIYKEQTEKIENLAQRIAPSLSKKGSGPTRATGLHPVPKTPSLV